MLARRLRGVCAAEGLAVNDATLGMLSDQCGGDLRSILGQLQMARLRQTALSYDDAKSRASKDADLSFFDVARSLLGVCFVYLMRCLFVLFCLFVCVVCLFVCLFVLFVCFVCLFVCFVCFVLFVCFVCLFCLFVCFVCLFVLFVRVGGVLVFARGCLC
jgi:hypothetical protein